MTAMGIIGIILASVFGVVVLMGGIYALLEEQSIKKRKMTMDIIDHAMVTFSRETQELIGNVMKDAIKEVPNMVKGMCKTLEEDEES